MVTLFPHLRMYCLMLLDKIYFNLPSKIAEITISSAIPMVCSVYSRMRDSLSFSADLPYCQSLCGIIAHAKFRSRHHLFSIQSFSPHTRVLTVEQGTKTPQSAIYKIRHRLFPTIPHYSCYVYTYIYTCACVSECYKQTM